MCTRLRINRLREETAAHKTRIFSKDNVWHMANTSSRPSSVGSCLSEVLATCAAESFPVLRFSIRENTRRTWRGQRRAASQPWLKRHVQMEVQARCWWAALTHYSSKTFCSETSAVPGSAPHPQNKEPEWQQQPKLQCQSLFLLSLLVLFKHFSPILILFQRHQFPLLGRAGDDVIPELWPEHQISQRKGFRTNCSFRPSTGRKNKGRRRRGNGSTFTKNEEEFIL